MSETKNFKELHRRIFELTLALYRVTDFFPQGEVLRRNLREKANDIFGLAAEYDYSAEQERDATLILSKIQSVRGYLDLARSLRFVKSINITVLEREYDFLASFFEKELEMVRPKETAAERKPEDAMVKKDEKVDMAVEEILPTWEEFSTKPVATAAEENSLSPIQRDLTNRQKAILEHLRNSGQAKISDFFAVFNGISSKTIQRDLQDLVGRNVLKKEGEKRWTTYSLS